MQGNLHVRFFEGPGPATAPAYSTPRDRLTEKVDPTGYSLRYGYDAAGNRTSLTATIGAEVYTTVYTHDALNRVATVTDSQGGVTTLGYDANGNQASLEHPSGVVTSYAYDALNRLTDLRTETSAGDVLQSYAYTLGLAGNRTRVDEHDGTSRHYGYDDLYRLIQDRVTDSADALVYQRDFRYDPVGNRLGQTIEEGSGPGVVDSTYDERDRLLTAAGTAYGWDANGNLETEDGNAYAWDTENRLVSVTLADGTVIDNVYDADGNQVRLRTTVPAGSATNIDFLVDSAGTLSHSVVEIVDGSVHAIYVRSDDRLIALLRPSGQIARYFHTDGLASVRCLSNDNASITDRYEYSAFGEVLGEVGSDLQPYRFSGEPYGYASGLYYHRVRWMDPSTGRFTSTDPFSGLLSKPTSQHPYTYAHNQPTTLIDPTGMFADGLVGLGIANAVRGIVTNIQVDVGFHILSSPPLDPKGDISNALVLLALAAGGPSAVKGIYSIFSSLSKSLSKVTDAIRKIRFERVFGHLRLLLKRMKTPRASLPPFTGGKTHGALHVLGYKKPVPLVSGRLGPSQGVRGKRLPGFNSYQLTHVEGHAAAYMRTTGKKHTILDINNQPCSRVSGGGCDGLLPRMLPEDAIMLVRHPNGVKTYIGIPDP